MSNFIKYNYYLYIFHLNKINLKKLQKNLNRTKIIFYVNDRKKETPKVFFHYYLSLIFYLVLNGQKCFIIKKLGKSSSQTQLHFFFFFFK